MVDGQLQFNKTQKLIFENIVKLLSLLKLPQHYLQHIQQFQQVTVKHNITPNISQSFMKYYILPFVLIALALSFKIQTQTSQPSFQQFIKIYTKKYKNNIDFIYRKTIYKNNLKVINALNQQEQASAVYGVNEFADLTTEELKLKFGVKYDPEYQISYYKNYTDDQVYVPKVNTPDTWNWTSQGAVSPVKNQGSCGSCWAFSISQNVQGQYWMKNKKLVEMSAQQSVDCDKSNYGCNGGWPYAGIQFLASHGGLESLEDYPLRKNYSGPCDFNADKAKAKVKGYMNITKNQTIIKDALYELGPMSILLDFQGLHYYKSGVASPLLCSTWPDHALLLVGYGNFKNDDYWLIKNSWGSSWGQNGYLMLFRGKNKCAVGQFATTAVLQ